MTSWLNSNVNDKRSQGAHGVQTAAAVTLALVGAVLGGCAKHSDFVDIRDELRTVVKTQEQEQKRLEGVQRRVQSLEAVREKDTDPSRQRIEDLMARVTRLESKIAKLEESPASSGRTDAATPPPPARLPKPAPSDAAGSGGALLPGVPGLSPTSAFNLAYNDYLNGRYDMAVTGFQKFTKDFPTASLVPNAYYWLGESYYNLKDYVRAMQAYEQVVVEHPASEKVASALYKIGMSASETGDTGKARKYLKRVIEEFAMSEEAKLAKSKLVELR
ncbi:MAG: tol-pal system protein YbgF [Nitrospiraceae bacterium]